MLDPERDYTDSDLAALEAAEREKLENFSLDDPALLCRWRLSDRALPLANRHMRALGARMANESPLTPELVAWVKQHIEWTLGQGAWEHPDGVLMLVVDKNGHAAMSVGEYLPLAATATADLAGRAALGAVEGAETGVAPETLWAVRDGSLAAGLAQGSDPSGAATLVFDLASTLGIPVTFEPDLAARALDGGLAADEVFLVSDEHGVVPAADAAGPLSQKFADGYQRLLEAQKNRGRRY